jgi:DNA invertase Pin-like site-specific DNA recombinase
MKVIIQSRCSSHLQDYQRQTSELREYANQMGYDVVGVFEETISGAKKNEERPIFMELLSYVKNKKVDKVLAWELSRIGRNTIEILKTIEIFNSMGVSLYIKNFNIETLNPDGKPNLMANFMVQVLSSISEMERTSIRQRMESGYRNHLANGGSVGRKMGFRKDSMVFLSENKDVAKLLKQGLSVRKVMKLTDKSGGTVMKVKRCIAG